MTLAEHVGELVRESRIEQGLTLEEVAKRCGYSKTYMGDIEHGRKNPTLFALEAIARALGMSIGGLWASAERRKEIAAMTLEERLARIAELSRG